MSPSARRFIPIGIAVAALTLAGCVTDGSMPGASGGARPKTMVVSDFVISSDVAVIDRGFTSRLERKIGGFPTHERKQRTTARVNDEIVASIVATMREAGMAAQPGNEEALTLHDDALVVSGRLRPANQASTAKNKQIGFGAGHSGVVADMALEHVSGGAKRKLAAFTAEAPSGRRPSDAVKGKEAAARNAAIAAALAAEGTVPEKLSADVEAQARRLGRAAGEKIVAYAKQQGWLEKPADAAAEMAAEKTAETADTQTVRTPEARPEVMPENTPN